MVPIASFTGVQRFTLVGLRKYTRRNKYNMRDGEIKKQEHYAGAFFLAAQCELSCHESHETVHHGIGQFGLFSLATVSL